MPHLGFKEVLVQVTQEADQTGPFLALLSRLWEIWAQKEADKSQSSQGSDGAQSNLVQWELSLLMAGVGTGWALRSLPNPNQSGDL